MNRLVAFIRSFLTWSTFRYGIAGTICALFSLGGPILINSETGIPLEACLPVVYAMALALQFTLQRLFVFRHIRKFALPLRRQILWYGMIAAIQYPLSALATAILPRMLGLPERVVYVAASLTIAILTFLFLRRNVFHPHDSTSLEDLLLTDSPAAERSPAKVH